ncbi:MAG: AEC family transporter [Nitrospira sp.]|nr:AEC family transporter [Nitrospira sp.]
MMPLSLHVFIATFVVGILLRSRGILTKVHAERLATFVFSVSLPTTILISLDRVVLTSTAWKLPLAACLVTLPMVFCSWQMARVLSLPRAAQGGFILATSSINSVYFAFPVILATFGEEGLTYAVLFDLGQTTLTLTVLYGLALWHSTQTAARRSVAIRFLSSPPLWALACILAIKLSERHLPLWLIDLLKPLHFTTTPLASLVLGLSISFSTIQRTARLATWGVATRVGGGLLLGAIAVWVLGLTGVERAVVLLIAAMPSAVSALIIAAETHLDEELTASIVALSVGLGVLMLPWLPRLTVMLLG